MGGCGCTDNVVGGSDDDNDRVVAAAFSTCLSRGGVGSVSWTTAPLPWSFELRATRASICSAPDPARQLSHVGFDHGKNTHGDAGSLLAGSGIDPRWIMSIWIVSSSYMCSSFWRIGRMLGVVGRIESFDRGRVCLVALSTFVHGGQTKATI